MVNNLIDAAKIQAESIEITKTPVKLLGLIENIWNINLEFIKKTKLYAKLYISTKIPHVLLNLD